MAKKLPYNLHGWALSKIIKFVLTKKIYEKLVTISVTKAWSDPKVNPQIDKGSQPINYKAIFSQRDNIYLVDLKCNVTYQNIREETKVKLISMSWKV